MTSLDDLFAFKLGDRVREKHPPMPADADPEARHSPKPVLIVHSRRVLEGPKGTKLLYVMRAAEGGFVHLTEDEMEAAPVLAADEE